MSSTASEKLILAGFAVPHPDKRERSVELWRALADDARATHHGNVSIELYEEQEEGDEGAYLVLDQFANASVRDSFINGPIHMAIATKVHEEQLIKQADMGFYKHVFGAGKTIGGDLGEGKVVVAAFIVVEEGRREMAMKQWENAAEVIRTTERGEGLAMEVFSFHEGVDGRKGEEDKFFVVYEFSNQRSKDEIWTKRQTIGMLAEGDNKNDRDSKSVISKVCKHVLGSGSGIKAT